MGLVGVGVKQDYRNRLEAGRANCLRSGLDCCLVQGRRYGAVDPNPARHLEDVTRLNRPLGLYPGKEIGRARDFGPPDFQHMAEPLRGDKPGANALSLQDRVGDDGRAMQDGRYLRRAYPGPVEHPVNACEETVGRGARHRRRLCDMKRAAGAVRQNDVRESASHIEAQRIACGHGPPITGSVWPVIQPARSDARNSTAWAMSSGFPSRRMAMPSTIAARSSGLRASHCRT